MSLKFFATLPTSMPSAASISRTPSRFRYNSAVATASCSPPRFRHQRMIPSCVLRSHSEMGEIGHRTEKLPIVFKLTQLITKGINNGFKRGKSTIIKGFFPYFLPNMLNGIQFRTVGRLWDQTNILWNNKIFGIMPSSLINLYHKKIFGKGSTNML